MDLVETSEGKEKVVRENWEEPGFMELVLGELAPVYMVQGEGKCGEKKGKHEHERERRDRVATYPRERLQMVLGQMDCLLFQ